MSPGPFETHDQVISARSGGGCGRQYGPGEGGSEVRPRGALIKLGGVRFSSARYGSARGCRGNGAGRESLLPPTERTRGLSAKSSFPQRNICADLPLRAKQAINLRPRPAPYRQSGDAHTPALCTENEEWISDFPFSLPAAFVFLSLVSNAARYRSALVRSAEFDAAYACASGESKPKKKKKPNTTTKK